MSFLPGAKFTYAVKKNKDMLKIEIKAMEEANEPSKEFKEYTEAQGEINRKFAEKDAKGNPKTEQRRIGAIKKRTFFIIPGIDDPNSKFTKATEKLAHDHKEVIDIQAEKEEEYQEFLKEDTEWKPFMIDLESVPDGIHQEVMDRIHFMIKETEL